jgi:hypothetical protein
MSMLIAVSFVLATQTKVAVTSSKTGASKLPFVQITSGAVASGDTLVISNNALTAVGIPIDDLERVNIFPDSIQVSLLLQAVDADVDSVVVRSLVSNTEDGTYGPTGSLNYGVTTAVDDEVIQKVFNLPYSPKGYIKLYLYQFGATDTVNVLDMKMYVKGTSY